MSRLAGVARKRAPHEAGLSEETPDADLGDRRRVKYAPVFAVPCGGLRGSQRRIIGTSAAGPRLTWSAAEWRFGDRQRGLLQDKAFGSNA